MFLISVNTPRKCVNDALTLLQVTGNFFTAFTFVNKQKQKKRDTEFSIQSVQLTIHIWVFYWA